MDLMRWLSSLPWRVLRATWHALAVVFSGIVGEFDWRAPRWAVASRHGLGAIALAMKRRPQRSAGLIMTILVAGLAGWIVLRWWQHRPHPPQPVAIRLTASPPALTDYDKDPVVIDTATIHFTGSAAPIDRVGKAPDTDDVTLDPPLAGSWQWRGDRTLVFTPKGDWPVGQHFDVGFDTAHAFAAQARIPDPHTSFDTAPFKASTAQAEFYQNPEDAQQKQAIFTIRFSHPVNASDFEKRLELAQKSNVPDAKSVARKFVVTYDRKKINAFVRSEPLDVPKDASTVTLGIDKGVHALAGGSPLAKAVTSTVAVPSLYSLGVDQVDALLVDNDRYEPEQVINLTWSQSVADKDAVRAVGAWLLPVFDPALPADQRQQPTDWSGNDDIPEALLGKAQKLDLAPIAGERDDNAAIGFKYHADAGRYVVVRVTKGLVSFGGYRLGKTWQQVVRVPDYPRMLRFMADGALLSLGGDKRVAVVARNMPGMRVDIGRVLPDQLQHLVSFNRTGTFAKPDLDTLTPDNIVERFEQKVSFDADDPTKPHYQGVDLGRYLGKDKRGVFLLQMRGYDKRKEDAKESSKKPDVSTAEDAAVAAVGDSDDDSAAVNAGDDEGGGEGDGGDDVSTLTDSRLIVVTDLGTVLKKSLDGSIDVFVQSIASGAPVADAKVSIIGKNGQPLVHAASNADGCAHFDPLQGFDREKTPTLVTIELGEDFAFLPYAGRDRRLDFSRFDVGGIRNARDAGQLAAYLFSDRGLYRPGETFHVGFVVRAADWTRSLTGVPLQADIVDPRGLVVDTRKLKLGANAFEELAYTTQETSPTGAWSVNLSLVKDSGEISALGSTTVQVKEFLPDRMKATVHLSSEVADGWVKPEDLSARVDLMNLFGTPAQDRRVEATLTLSPSWPMFPKYKAYAFFDPNHAKQGYSEALGEKKTDDKGEIVYPLDLGKYASATYRLHVLAKGYEAEGGRSVAAETATLVSSLDYLVGTHADGALDYITRDGKRVVNLIAIDPAAKRIAVDKLTAAIVERRYVSILTKQDSGVYKYVSRPKEIPVSEKPLSIGASGFDYELPTATPGSYALVIRNARGEELNRVAFAIAGSGNLSRSLERNAELELALSKHDYAPGEDIEVAIRAPYAGAGLITIERDRVYAQAWFKATTTGSVQKIRVPEGFEGNGYVNVQFIRDPGSDEIFMSPLSYGVVPFSVNLDARRDPVSVELPDRIKPGGDLTMKVTVAKPARVVVFAVDEGILQVARYKLGDPLDFFFKKRMLEVTTSQTLDLILPEFAKLAGMAAPGGDEDAALGRHLNPFRKKHAPPVAYWSGVIEVADAKDLHWTVPDDFNGRLRVMAVAVAPDQVGTFEGATTVRGDFVLSPNLPQMVAPGDEFEVSTGVANNLSGLGGKTSAIAVKLAVEGSLEVVGAAEQSLALGEMREGVALFRLRAKGEPGVAKLSFTASSGDHRAKLGDEISVRPAVPYRSEVALGTLGNGNAEVKPLRDMFAAHAKRDASISYSPLILARGLSAYLDDFPHQCTEQLISRGVPALVLDAHPAFGSVRYGKDVPSPAAAFDQLIAVMRSRQNGEGGFGLWHATTEAEPFVSAYAVEFLLEAKQRGKRVPADMLARANVYLTSMAASESDDSLAALRARAFAIYLLTRQGQVTTNLLASVRQSLDTHFPKAWKNDIAAAYLAASLQLMKQDKEAASLIAGPQAQLERKAEAAGWHYENFYDPLIRDSDTLYLLARHFPKRARGLSPYALQNVVAALHRGQYNTLSSAQTILALDAYADSSGADVGKLAIAAIGKGGAAQPIAKVDDVVVAAKFAGDAAALRFSNVADANAWYSVAQTGFDREVPTVERKEGLEIVRDYTDAEGHPLARVQLGDEIQVHLKIRATRADGVANIAIVDLLPGGFEPVQETHATTNAPAASDAGASTGSAAEEGSDATGSNTTQWLSPIGTSASTWHPDYADVRDDRVVIYGYASTDVQEFVYRIKATNAGTFVVPPAYGESLYDRSVQAQSKSGGTLVVERK